MSITDAFRNLNSSIRGVREQEMAHEQRMTQAKIQEQQILQEANDPSRRLKAQQAADQLSPTTATSFGFSTKGKTPYQIATWEQDTLKDLNSIALEGSEYDKTGQLVFKGTSTPYVDQKWKIEQHRMKAETMMAMGNYEDKALQKEKSKLEYDIGDLESKNAAAKGPGHSGWAMGDANRMKAGLLKQRLSQVSKAMEDPDVNAKSLLTSNKRLMINLDSLYKSKNPNQKMIDNVLTRIDANTKMLSQLSSKSTVKMREYNYYQKGKDGEVFTMKRTYPDDGTTPKFYEWGPNGRYTLGTYKAGEDGGNSKNGGLNQAQQNKVLDDYIKAKLVVATAEIDIDNEDALKQTISENNPGMSQEDQNDLLRWFKTANTQTKSEYKNKLKNYEDRYGGMPFTRHIIPSTTQKNKNLLGLEG